MNDVVATTSTLEDVAHIWWLFLDADEFPHGPWGMTLRAYLETLDRQFRIVGTRFFDHYPSGVTEYIPNRHPLDFQPLCEELAYPMCPAHHRKHPLQRYDRDAPWIECGPGFHVARCTDRLHEPAQPAFLHHFPFREQHATRRRLEALWSQNADEPARALQSRDTHMLARFQSLDAVYGHRWSDVRNFIAMDPMVDTISPRPSPAGVQLKPWDDSVGNQHRHVLRWYSMIDAWRYNHVEEFDYGDDQTYRKGISFLDGHGTIEDWGCGFARARRFVTQSRYIGIDGSSNRADRIVELRNYRSETDCIFMRHVLEHNAEWRRILENAVISFKKRMVLIVFTPMGSTTRQIDTSTTLTTIPVPDISFKKTDLTDCFKHLSYTEESVQTNSQYGAEHLFYIEAAS